jgi:hypothetical protein
VHRVKKINRGSRREWGGGAGRAASTAIEAGGCTVREIARFIHRTGGGDGGHWCRVRGETDHRG